MQPGFSNYLCEKKYRLCYREINHLLLKKIGLLEIQ